MKKILTLLICSFAIFSSKAQQLENLISFIKANPKKASVFLIEDGQTTINYQSSQLMPLASAAKTIIAIEFAKQATAKKIDPSKKISAAELAKYYIPNTDGNAHPEWLKSLNGKKDSISLLEIAKGMIKFSSNANTEFLQDYLGLASINQSLKSLGLKNHQPHYYFTASALMTCLKPKGLSDEQWIENLNRLSMSEYRSKCEVAHKKLKTDPTFIQTFNFNNLNATVQKAWSDRLVASTTSDYANLMQRICDRSYFDSKTQSILESILEWPMAYPSNQKMFNHLGQKGGSTSFILTDAFYADQKAGNKLACAFFFNNLTEAENKLVSSNFGNFEASILTSKAFRVKLADALN